MEIGQQAIIEAANNFHKLGLAVFPVEYLTEKNGKVNKKPYGTTWEQWNQRDQTDEEFKALDFTRCYAIGVVLGRKTKEGLYLGCVDYDVKGNQSEESKRIGKEIFKEFPTTKTESTLNKGLHAYFLSRNPISNLKKYHDSTALELLGKGHFSVISPSKGYILENDNGFTVIEHLEKTFLFLLEKHGIEVTKKQEPIKRKIPFATDVRPCFVKLMEKAHLEHNEKLFLVNEFYYTGKTEAETKKIFSDHHAWEPSPEHDYNLQKTYYQIETIYRDANKLAQDGKSYRNPRSTLQELKLCLTTCPYRNMADCREANTPQQTDLEVHAIRLAKNIMEDFDFVVDSETEKLYYYDDEKGIYSEKAETLIKREIVKRLDDDTLASYYTDVDFFIRHSAPIIEFETQTELIAVQNGILNLITKELTPFTPKQYIINKLPVEYNPEATCPKIDKFLSEVLDEKDQKIIIEYVGYLLYRKVIHHKAFLAVGSGGNGKSVFLDLNTALIGKENTSNQTIQNLCYNRFMIAELHNKMANVCADLPNARLKSTGIFKMLVAGDRVAAEKKNEDPFYFSSYAKLMFSCNAIPPIDNTEDQIAYYRRWIIVEFKRQFQGTDDNKNLRYELTTPEELSGYLNKALEGLKRLLENKDFSETNNLEETRNTYIKRSNSCQAFINEMLEVTDSCDDVIFTDDVYHDFITYCHKEKITTQPQGAFTKAIKEFCYGAEHFKRRKTERKGESPVSAFRYLRLKTPTNTIQLNLVPDVPDVPLVQSQQPESLFDKTVKKGNNENIISGKRVESSGTSGTLGTNQEVIRFLRLSDNEPDTQKCGRCQAVQAKIKISSNIAGVRFACEGCFNEYRFNVEPQGVKFVDETMPDSEGDFSR